MCTQILAGDPALHAHPLPRPWARLCPTPPLARQGTGRVRRPPPTTCGESCTVEVPLGVPLTALPSCVSFQTRELAQLHFRGKGHVGDTSLPFFGRGGGKPWLKGSQPDTSAHRPRWRVRGDAGWPWAFALGHHRPAAVNGSGSSPGTRPPAARPFPARKRRFVLEQNPSGRGRRASGES